jgi:hypothetical protein
MKIQCTDWETRVVLTVQKIVDFSLYLEYEMDKGRRSMTIVGSPGVINELKTFKFLFIFLLDQL